MSEAASQAAGGTLSTAWLQAATWHRAMAGRKRYALAAGLGLLAALALPPLHVLPILLIVFPAFVWLLDGATSLRQAFLIAWSFAIGYFVAGLYWVGIAMTVDLARFGWFIPFSTLGLSIGLGLFPALTIAAAWRLGWHGPGRIPLLAAAWVLAELLRGFVLTGFPWNLLGTVWTFHPLPQQLAAVTGVWGLSVVTILAAAAPALLADGRRQANGQRRSALRMIGIAYALLALMLAFGALRLMTAPAATLEGEGPRLRVVQPSIPQAEKWVGSLRPVHVERQIALSQRPGFADIDLVIWPETSVPYYLNREPAVRQRIADAAPPGGFLLTGSIELERTADSTDVYNALFVLDPVGNIVSSYRKFHLVPFGEYVPFRDLLPMDKITAGKQDFTPGPGLTSSLTIGTLPAASALICYEIIFSGRVTASGEPRPGWLLNLTNDAWFGHSSGPYQHFASAKLRSIEEGLPLVRAANNGISAVVDGYGRVLGRLELDEVDILDANLPPSLTPTPYAIIGRWTVAILLILLALWHWLLRSKPERS